MNWISKMTVRGSRGDLYTVSVAESGAWGCSCPAWRFKKKDHATGERPDCKHIIATKAGMVDELNRRRAEPQRRRVRPVSDAKIADAKTGRFAGLESEAQEVRELAVDGTRFSGLDYEITASV